MAELSQQMDGIGRGRGRRRGFIYRSPEVLASSKPFEFVLANTAHYLCHKYASSTIHEYNTDSDSWQLNTISALKFTAVVQLRASERSEQADLVVSTSLYYRNNVN